MEKVRKAFAEDFNAPSQSSSLYNRQTPRLGALMAFNQQVDDHQNLEDNSEDFEELIPDDILELEI